MHVGSDQYRALAPTLLGTTLIGFTSVGIFFAVMFLAFRESSVSILHTWYTFTVGPANMIAKQRTRDIYQVSVFAQQAKFCGVSATLPFGSKKFHEVSQKKGCLLVPMWWPIAYTEGSKRALSLTFTPLPPFLLLQAKPPERPALSEAFPVRRRVICVCACQNLHRPTSTNWIFTCALALLVEAVLQQPVVLLLTGVLGDFIEESADIFLEVINS